MLVNEMVENVAETKMLNCLTKTVSNLKKNNFN